MIVPVMAVSVAAGGVTMALSVLAGHPVLVSVLSYVLGGVCMMLALALRLNARAAVARV